MGVSLQFCVLWGMFIRHKPNKSGTFSVQVVSKRDGRYILEKSFGASSDEVTLKDLELQASDWMDHYHGQGVIDSVEHEMQEDSRLMTESVLDNTEYC